MRRPWLSPSSFVSLGNGQALFEGTGTNGLAQLWITNGTAAGTQQLTNLDNVNEIGGLSETTGLSPSGFLSLGNGKVIFTGYGTDGLGQLWVTNGTAAGTQQLTNLDETNSIAGAVKTTGLSPSSFVSLGNGQALFEGTGTNGLAQLWITNGTAAGTQQLTNLDNVNEIGGLSETTGLSPSGFLSLGNGKVIFTGYGTDGLGQLWVTNGTAAGTQQLTNLDNVNEIGGFSETTGLSPSDFVSLGNGQALFEGTGTNGLGQLWITNGTAAGTHQLTSLDNVNNFTSIYHF